MIRSSEQGRIYNRRQLFRPSWDLSGINRRTPNLILAFHTALRDTKDNRHSGHVGVLVVVSTPTGNWFIYKFIFLKVVHQLFIHDDIGQRHYPF